MSLVSPFSRSFLFPQFTSRNTTKPSTPSSCFFKSSKQFSVISNSSKQLYGISTPFICCISSKKFFATSKHSIVFTYFCTRHKTSKPLLVVKASEHGSNYSEEGHRKSKKNKKKKNKGWFERILMQAVDIFGIEGYGEEEEKGGGEQGWEEWVDSKVDYDFFKKENGNKEWDEGGYPREEVDMPERGMFRNDKEITLGLFMNSQTMDEDIAYEDKVFTQSSQISAKFLAFLFLVPWAVGLVFHDCLMVPFLNRYVEHAPFVAQMLDARKDQKLKIMDALKVEKLRIHFISEIQGIQEPTDEELREHTKHKAREIREEVRLENRKAFANIWSDMVAAITGVLIYILNPEKVEIMKFTGSRIFKGTSDTGKAFLLILVTDIFLGYHSESGWHTLVEMLLEHYGLIVDDAAITIFICTVPVTMDVCFKLWVFKYLPRLSPSTAATFHEMKRH